MLVTLFLFLSLSIILVPHIISHTREAKTRPVRIARFGPARRARAENLIRLWNSLSNAENPHEALRW